MPTPVTANRPAAPIARAAAPAAAPATKAAEVARPAGDAIALSATAKAAAPGKTVVIDGKEYELREKDVKKKWPLWEKVTTFGITGVGTVMGFMTTVAMAAPMSPTGAMSPAIWAFLAIGTGISLASSYGVGRLASKIVHGVGNLID